MNESGKHTPGPWYVGVDKMNRRRVFAGDREIVRALSKHGERFLSEGEREANRTLIAAAPDMLAALEAWMQTNAGIPAYSLRPLEVEARELTRAALTKAGRPT